jgi:hypothetical protein
LVLACLTPSVAPKQKEGGGGRRSQGKGRFKENEQEKSVSYEVVKLSDLASIIEHFNNYPLKTKKYADFLLFKKALDIVSNKEHLTMAGLTKLINIRATRFPLRRSQAKGGFLVPRFP